MRRRRSTSFSKRRVTRYHYSFVALSSSVLFFSSRLGLWCRRHRALRRVDTIAFPFRFREARSIVSEICSDIIAAFSLSLERRKKKTVCCIGAGYVGGPTMAMIALKCPHIEVESVSSFSRVSSSSSSSSISLLAGFVSKGGVRSTARVEPFVRLFRRHHERGREKSETKDFHRPTRESKTTTKRGGRLSSGLLSLSLSRECNTNLCSLLSFSFPRRAMSRTIIIDVNSIVDAYYRALKGHRGRFEPAKNRRVELGELADLRTRTG